MSSELTIALIALVGAILSAGISLYGQLRAPVVTAQREADAVLARFREPLVSAAYELQGRLFNILERKFLQRYYTRGDDAQRTYAIENTLYVVAQYFGWSEILRREVQFLSFADSERTRRVAERQADIVELFQSDKKRLGRPLLFWRGEQRAIGELMIEHGGAQLQCIGYATFVTRREREFRRWFERLDTELRELATTSPNPRLTELQHALVDLVRELDPDQVRYPDEKLRKVVPPATQG
jgi:hypothetical protein